MFGKSERGNVLLYVFMAVGLMAALTYSYVKGSRENISAQSAVRLTEEVYVQANLIRAAVIQCAMEYPEGGGNIDDTGGSAGKIDDADNPNNPYPLNPSSTLYGAGAAANDNARNLMCFTEADPAVTSNMFSGANNQGRFLPPPPTGFTEWVYVNDADGVYIQTDAPNDVSGLNTLDRLMTRFAACQADLNYDTCGARCFTVWIQRNACP